MHSRRSVLRGLGTATLVGALAPGRIAFGAAPTEARLVVVILRGGLDGLHAVPPYADPHYARLRPNIALGRPGEETGALDLNGYFGLHPALAPLHAMYRDRQLLVIPAATTSYRSRSHFDGQNLLENGTARPFGAQDGWLNRALRHLNGGDRRFGLSLGHAVPLVMRGDIGVRTWAPSRLPKVGDDFVSRLARLYENDPLFADALREAVRSQAGSAGMMAGANAAQGGRDQFRLLAEAAGQMLAVADGPRIAVLEAGGWDTHFRQAPRLQRRLGELADGIETLRRNLGPPWRRTVVVVVSEFGRTAAENGSRGTDHGVGGIALLCGGAVAGGRIAGDWPGLSASALYERRDVRPTTDYRSLFKALLRDHLGVSEAALEDDVFPASRNVRPLDGIVRRS